MPAWGRWLAPLSPLTYSADLIRGGFGEPNYFARWVDAAALVGFALAFLAAARFLHQKTRDRAL
jgi:ABC-2 type transport system permease protein